MNVFSFDLSTAVTSLNHSVLYGLTFGFILGFFRFIILSTVERQTP